jgi:hypothetical protein
MDCIETTTSYSSIFASRSCRTDRVENIASKVSLLMRVRNLLPSNGRCLQSHFLATGLHATIWLNQCSLLQYNSMYSMTPSATEAEYIAGVLGWLLNNELEITWKKSDLALLWGNVIASVWTDRAKSRRTSGRPENEAGVLDSWPSRSVTTVRNRNLRYLRSDGDN